MKGRPTSGISIVENLLAVLILTLALIPTVNLMVGAARQTTQTSDFELATTVVEKVSEESRLGAWENVHFAEQIEAGATSPMATVVDARSPFFGAIEDSAPPYGRIRQGEDTGITTATGRLYTELRSFFVGSVSAPRALPSTGEVVDLSVVVEWSGVRSQPSTMKRQVTLPKHGAVDASPAAVEDRTQADDQIRQTLFPTFPGVSLTRVVETNGGRLETVRALGDVVTIVTGFLAQQRTSGQTVASLEADLARASDPPAAAWARIRLARFHESEAASRLQAIEYLAPRLALLASQFEFEHLGRRPPPRNACRRAVNSLPALARGFSQSLVRARQEYAKLYNAETAALAPRVRVRLFMKILDLVKLELLTGGSLDVRALKTMLADFMEYHEGRNPNFYQFAGYELERCGDVESVRRNYAAQDRLSRYTEFSLQVPRVIKRLAAG